MAADRELVVGVGEGGNRGGQAGHRRCACWEDRSGQGDGAAAGASREAASPDGAATAGGCRQTFVNRLLAGREQAARRGHKGAAAVDAVTELVDEHATCGGENLLVGGDVAGAGCEADSPSGGDRCLGADAAAGRKADPRSESGVAEGRGLGDIRAGTSGRIGLRPLEAGQPGSAGQAEGSGRGGNRGAVAVGGGESTGDLHAATADVETAAAGGAPGGEIGAGADADRTVGAEAERGNLEHQLVGVLANRDGAGGRQAEGGIGFVGGDGATVGATAEGEGAGGGAVGEGGEVGGRRNIGQGFKREIPGLADFEALGAAQ